MKRMNQMAAGVFLLVQAFSGVAFAASFTLNGDSVDFTFDGPRDVNDPVAAGEYQYRTIRSGQVDGELTFTATTARLVLIKLRMALGEGADKPLANFTLQKNADGDAWDLASAEI